MSLWALAWNCQDSRLSPSLVCQVSFHRSEADCCSCSTWLWLIWADWHHCIKAELSHCSSLDREHRSVTFTFSLLSYRRDLPDAFRLIVVPLSVHLPNELCLWSVLHMIHLPTQVPVTLVPGWHGEILSLLVDFQKPRDPTYDDKIILQCVVYGHTTKKDSTSHRNRFHSRTFRRQTGIL